MNKLYPNHRRTWRRTVTRLSLNGLVSLSAVTGLFIAPSCSTTEPEGGVETNLRITLAPSITTRVTGTAFDEEDAIGLSVVPWSDGREQPLSSSRWEDNVKFVYRDGQFVSSATAYFPDATTANTFYAYYPYNQTGFRSNTSSLAVAVATDQSDAASRTASDWMVAVTRNVKPDGQAVPVAFRHILSLMQIRMTAGDGVTADELLEAEVLLKDFCSTALYDVDAETFGEPADVTDIRPYGTTRIEGDYVTGLSAVVVPQTREAGETVIYFTFKGKTMAYKPSSEFTFEPGKSHLFTATIGMTPQGRRSPSAPKSTIGGRAASLRAMPQTRVALCQRLRWQHLSRHRNQRREVARRQPPHHALQRRHGDTGRRRRHGRMGRTDRARRLHHGE